MSPAVAALLLVASYLVGAVPFGYLVARLKGVDLFSVGSGNIGATNVGRVLGRKYGVLVFVLDFLKGAVPVAVVVPLARATDPAAPTALGTPELLRVGAAVAAFLGHLFPVYLGFRGGKGVATGAGTIAVLVPGPAALAVAAWIIVALASRTVSLASLVAVVVLTAARLLTPGATTGDGLYATAYCLVGSLVVVVKHRANIGRLIAGTENRIGDGPMRHTLLRALHLLALGLWFGGAGFFNFGAAVPIFDSFKQVVATSPSDRTAYVDIVPPGASEQQRADLANALAGSAVGPVFPRYFAMQAACGVVALVTALAWWNADGGRRVHRWRVYLLAAALLTVAVAWPVSNAVSELRVQRFDPNPGVAAAAKTAFGPWHLVSLLLSFVTVSLAGIGLALGAKLPHGERGA